ncbi:MAG: UDP-3-O-(3-hydroxymyristoyl)glucosamine N-acyltransferase [Rhodospirillales bacterium]|nr:UDP-3-O-(3-hydroxymyristoyl)glucosamine N-acyltransferase [Alphaproteobacteria bacterium]MCB9987382.1 UDP-3-O-(3-hydroxymyristoyl)glucosamine N-acyltransferase [Rhodospirillales bacterium]USO07771.1 MAG: UDP-3-O-(3-hydroxymyristoyl)glucosamine N-acyltransferase [Rhodospirillales bacterium]
MPDTRFHDRTGPYSLARIAEASECVLADPAAGGQMIADVAPLIEAGAEQLSFLDNPKYRNDFRASRAGACIVSAEVAAEAPEGMRVLISKNPYRSYALAAALFYPWPVAASISPQAAIDPSAEIGPGCIVEPCAVIGRGVQLGRGCWIGAGASLSHCILGERVRVHAGARIGQDGFGFALGAQGHLPVPQLGRVIIGDFVNIGANTTIDRGAGPDTVIGAGTVIDNLVQIGHNVRIGRGCVIVSQTGISGSSVLEDFVVMGGQSGMAGHLRVGQGARVAAQAGVTKDVPAGEEWVGFPAMPRRAYWKMQAGLKKLLSKG